MMKFPTPLLIAGAFSVWIAMARGTGRAQRFEGPWSDKGRASIEAVCAEAAPKLAPLVQASRMERLAVQSYPAEPPAIARSTS
jgi:hypothetical protein